MRLFVILGLLLPVALIPKKVVKSRTWYNGKGRFFDHKSSCKWYSMTRCCYDLLIETYTKKPLRLSTWQHFDGHEHQDWSIDVQAVILRTYSTTVHNIEFTCVDTRPADEVKDAGDVTNIRRLRVTCDFYNEMTERFAARSLIQNRDLLRDLHIDDSAGSITDARCIKRKQTPKRSAQIDPGERPQKTAKVVIKAQESDCLEVPLVLDTRASESHNYIASAEVEKLSASFDTESTNNIETAYTSLKDQQNPVLAEQMWNQCTSTIGSKTQCQLSVQAAYRFNRSRIRQTTRCC